MRFLKIYVTLAVLINVTTCYAAKRRFPRTSINICVDDYNRKLEALKKSPSACVQEDINCLRLQEKYFETEKQKLNGILETCIKPECDAILSNLTDFTREARLKRALCKQYLQNSGKVHGGKFETIMTESTLTFATITNHSHSTSDMDHTFSTETSFTKEESSEPPAATSGSSAETSSDADRMLPSTEPTVSSEFTTSATTTGWSKPSTLPTEGPMFPTETSFTKKDIDLSFGTTATFESTMFTTPPKPETNAGDAWTEPTVPSEFPTSATTTGWSNPSTLPTEGPMFPTETSFTKKDIDLSFGTTATFESTMFTKTPKPETNAGDAGVTFPTGVTTDPSEPPAATSGSSAETSSDADRMLPSTEPTVSSEFATSATTTGWSNPSTLPTEGPMFPTETSFTKKDIDLSFGTTATFESTMFTTPPKPETNAGDAGVTFPTGVTTGPSEPPAAISGSSPETTSDADRMLPSTEPTVPSELPTSATTTGWSNPSKLPTEGLLFPIETRSTKEDIVSSIGMTITSEPTIFTTTPETETKDGDIGDTFPTAETTSGTDKIPTSTFSTVRSELTTTDLTNPSTLPTEGPLFPTETPSTKVDIVSSIGTTGNSEPTIFTTTLETETKAGDIGDTSPTGATTGPLEPTAATSVSSEESTPGTNEILSSTFSTHPSEFTTSAITTDFTNRFTLPTEAPIFPTHTGSTMKDIVSSFEATGTSEQTIYTTTPETKATFSKPSTIPTQTSSYSTKTTSATTSTKVSTASTTSKESESICSSLFSEEDMESDSSISSSSETDEGSSNESSSSETEEDSDSDSSSSSESESEDESESYGCWDSDSSDATSEEDPPNETQIRLISQILQTVKRAVSLVMQKTSGLVNNVFSRVKNFKYRFTMGGE